jgi:O-antigen/teichoic acid export membrane protein
MTNTRTIARNTGWSGLETAISSIVALFTSVFIARYLGPSKNGYIVYVSFIAYVVSSLGGMGISATTRKYMAEFLGLGDRGTARFIYCRTLLLQTILATLATGGLLFWVMRSAAGEYKLASILIVLSIWPSMVNSISSQANAATEDMATNLPASVVSALTYFAAITATVVLKWGVTGVGASLLSMRAADFLVRFFPTVKRVLAWDAAHGHPRELRARMTSFAWQSLVSMAVALVVWNRSEVLLLGKFCADIRQVGFYSIAFSMADQLLVGATIFGTAAGTTIFAQYGRDKSRLPELTASAFRYLALTSIPLHFISAALAASALLLFFGHAYADAAMVVMLAPLLCMPKAFVGPVQSFLQSTERQSYVILATVLAGIVDIGVAWYLIPAHGAVGACIGSGAAQLMAAGMMWAVGIHVYKMKLPWLLVAKITLISVLASLTAFCIAVRLKPAWAILCGGSASLIILFGLLYLMRVLEPEDRDRFMLLAEMLPKPLVGPAERIISLLVRPALGGIASDNAFSHQAHKQDSEVSTVSAPVVLLIAYHFPPDNAIGGARIYRFYKYLKQFGYKCHVITAAVQEAGSPADIEYVAEFRNAKAYRNIGWQIERIVRKFFFRNDLKLWWFLAAFRAGRVFLKLSKNADVVILSSAPPVGAHLAGMGLAAFSGCKWIADGRDPINPLYGDHAFFQDFLAPRLVRLILKRADLALANTDAMQQVWHNSFSGSDKKTYILWNGFDPEDTIDTYVLPERQCKVLSHVGELYGGRSIRPVLASLARLIETGKVSKGSIVVRQIGAAEQNELPDPEFLRAAQAEGWLDIREPVPAREARALALDSDGLLLIQPHTGVQVPAKLFEYLRLGRPIFAFIVRDSPVEHILLRAGVPFKCIYPEHGPEEMDRRLLSFIAMLDGQPVSYNQWFADTFDASRQVENLAALIRSLTD